MDSEEEDHFHGPQNPLSAHQVEEGRIIPSSSFSQQESTPLLTSHPPTTTTAHTNSTQHTSTSSSSSSSSSSSRYSLSIRILFRVLLALLLSLPLLPFRLIQAHVPLPYLRVLKATIAYTIAMIFTFVPSLRHWVGPSSTHLAALAVFFYNPSRSRGAMMEYTAMGTLGMLFGASCAALGSLLITHCNIHGWQEEAKWIGIVGLGGICTFGIASAKAWGDRPSFYTAGSTATMTLYIFTSKELMTPGVTQVDWQVLFGLMRAFTVGWIISLVINWLLWTQRACHDLRNDISYTLASFRVLLRHTTKTFLLDPDMDPSALIEVMASHRQSFASLKKSLAEAKLEFLDIPTRSRLSTYADLVASLNRLSQLSGALVSCVSLQQDMVSGTTIGQSEKHKSLVLFLQAVGPGLRALAYTCKATMKRVQARFEGGHRAKGGYDQWCSSLAKARRLFEVSQAKAVSELYRRHSLSTPPTTSASSSSSSSMNLTPLGEPGEEVFLVYFFVFVLREWTEEMEVLVRGVQQLEQEGETSYGFFGRFILWVRGGPPSSPSSDAHGSSTKGKGKDPASLADYELLHKHVPKPEEECLHNSVKERGGGWKSTLRIRVWRALTWLKRFEVKYALKSGVFATLLLAPGFLPSTRDAYADYRGEWALISMAVVMTPTVGASNIVAIYRVLGTLVGCLAAYVAYELFPGNMYGLLLFSFLFALPSFHLILNSAYPKAGQFSCMAFTTVLMTKYPRHHEADLEVYHIAITRSISVTVGVLVGLIATNYVWPYEARVELRERLGAFFINLSRLYLGQISLYAKEEEGGEGEEEEEERDQDGNAPPQRPSSIPSSRGRPLSSLVHANTMEIHRSLDQSIREFMDFELALQLQLLSLRTLLAQTRHEPRLKGPFPTAAYGKILTSCQALLDRLLTLRMAITDDQWLRRVREDFIIPVQQERREMCSSILLYFYLLASALKLKTPMPPGLPQAAGAHRRLVQAVKALPAVKATSKQGANPAYIVYYAYVMVLSDLIKELDKLGEQFSMLFGVMGGRGVFDRYFT
ncbi:MAG: Fusaric acid resistance protein-like-domain-containing protein [Piptocephalis tieghemiana]|nr:MAG: Fusaric acid resistance protein-like-domain-containing protein [Piptocephalis tieghemiana]